MSRFLSLPDAGVFLSLFMVSWSQAVQRVCPMDLCHTPCLSVAPCLPCWQVTTSDIVDAVGFLDTTNEGDTEGQWIPVIVVVHIHHVGKRDLMLVTGAICLSRLFLKGAEVYRREGHCITCHQEKGQGLPAAQFPPLAESEWVVGQPERLIALTLHGLLGPMEVKGKTYQGLVPMTPFKGLKDDEIAAVLTYVRNAFGNQAPMIGPDTVRAVREATRNQNGFIQASTLLESFP